MRINTLFSNQCLEFCEFGALCAAELAGMTLSAHHHTGNAPAMGVDIARFLGGFHRAVKVDDQLVLHAREGQMPIVVRIGGKPH